METTAEQVNTAVTETKQDASAPTVPHADTLADPLAGTLARPLFIRGLSEILEQHGDWLVRDYGWAVVKSSEE